MVAGPGSITTLVNEISRLDPPIRDPRIARLQAELMGMARERVRALGAHSELSTGDLVNEVYLKLFVRNDAHPWESRRHFFGAASRAMQQVVVDLVRKLQVRRAHAPMVALLAGGRGEPDRMLSPESMVRLLEALEQADPVAAEVLRMRVFSGLRIEEAASVLELPLRTAQRKWTVARALARSWILARMEAQEDDAFRGRS